MSRHLLEKNSVIISVPSHPGMKSRNSLLKIGSVHLQFCGNDIISPKIKTTMVMYTKGFIVGKTVNCLYEICASQYIIDGRIYFLHASSFGQCAQNVRKVDSCVRDA